MVTDYLKHLFQSFNTITELSSTEHLLVSLVKSRKNVIPDTDIKLRINKLKNIKSSILVNDFGAGSKSGNEAVKQISTIARFTTIKPRFGQLFATIINHNNIIDAYELGTSFGIGTSYIGRAANQVTTIEGCENIATIAKETFSFLNLNNINLIVGEFSKVLPSINFSNSNPAFVYIDGNHQKDATLAYFNFFKSNLPENSILIFDDIYWSTEMKNAWREIQNQPYFTIDLFRAGIVLLRNRKAPLAIHLRY